MDEKDYCVEISIFNFLFTFYVNEDKIEDKIQTRGSMNVFY